MLLSPGWTGIEAFVSNPPSSETALRTPVQQAAVEALLDALSPHQHHLHYADRLASGQSVGSGQIGGACKNLIGRRLKANAARWRIRRVNRMAGLCSIMSTHHWEKYWQSQ